MRVTKALVFMCVSLATVGITHASGTIAVYALVERVVFEPNDTAPERIQIWGAFSFETTRFSYITPGLEKGPVSEAQRGYLYFDLQGNPGVALKEWRDLKAIAGSGQTIAFGNFDATRGIRLRPESEKPNAPDTYLTNAGIVKLRDGDPVATRLRQLLRRK